MIFRVSFEKGVVEYFDHQTFEKSSKVMTAKVRELTIFFSLKCGQAAHPVELKLRSGVETSFSLMMKQRTFCHFSTPS